MGQENGVNSLAVMNIEDVMVLKQLPEIEQKLSSVKAAVENRLKGALSLASDEATLKETKTIRTQIRKEFEQFEAGRKNIKEQIFAPYKSFEAVYEDCISDAYQQADLQLKEKIDTMESDIKRKKQTEAEQYFYEYAAALGLDFISFERLGLKINLSSTTKSLKLSIKAFLDGIQEDLQMISLQEHKEEILVEYKKSLNASEAIQMVILRHRAMEQERAARQIQQPEIESTPQEIPPDAVLQPPVMEEPEEQQSPADEEAKEPVYQSPVTMPENDDPVMELTFTVRATKSKLKALKAFLIEGGYEVE